MFSTSPVFQANYNATEDIVVNQGGTDSGKTVAILQILIVIGALTKPPLEDPIITVVSESIPNAKKGAYRVIQQLYAANKYFQSKVRDWNNGDRIIYFKSGWIMEFRPAIDEQDAKQGKRQYLFVNEANGIPWMIFWQYAKRTRVRTWIDYNPSAPFWAHEKLIGTVPEGNDLSATVRLIISDHRHNPFLSERDHYRTENIKDLELWKVYARGLTGNLHGLIYPDWKQIPDANFPWELSKFGGLDFGYTNDPTAGVRLSRLGNKIYVHELCYQEGLSPRTIKAVFKAAGFKSESPIYCEHDPDMIRQIRMLNMLAIAARKGQGSVNAGILKINKDYEVYYTASSKNIDYERRKYMWIIDPDTGKPTNTPTDLDNHCMDAIRMAIYTHFYRG